MSRRGVVYLRGRVSLSDPEQSALESSVDVNLLAIRYPQVGLLFEATPNLSFSLVYRHKFLLEPRAGLQHPRRRRRCRPRSAGQRRPLQEVAYSVDLFQPWQLVAGAAARFSSVLVSFDLTFSRWSEQPAPAARIMLNVDLGRFNEARQTGPVATLSRPGLFYDTLMPAVGVEWRALSGHSSGRLALDLRGGYRYEPSPVPEQDGESSFGDSDRHIFSLGLGVELSRLSQILPKPLSIDVFGAFTHLPLRRTASSIRARWSATFTVGDRSFRSEVSCDGDSEIRRRVAGRCGAVGSFGRHRGVGTQGDASVLPDRWPRSGLSGYRFVDADAPMRSDVWLGSRRARDLGQQCAGRGSTDTVEIWGRMSPRLSPEKTVLFRASLPVAKLNAEAEPDEVLAAEAAWGRRRAAQSSTRATSRQRRKRTDPLFYHGPLVMSVWPWSRAIPSKSQPVSPAVVGI